MGKKYAVSWSGGKDAALALYEAQSQGLHISCLLTMFAPDGFTLAHRIPREIVLEQARALNLPLVEGIATWDTYEDEFLQVLLQLKEKGTSGCIFGDIDIEEHIQWCQNICREAGLAALHPLYGKTQKQLLERFLALDFVSVIILVQLDKLGAEYIGKPLNADLISQFSQKDISPAGEFGEYHTLVVNGPIFQTASLQEKILSLKPRVITRQGYAFWDLANIILPDK